MAAAEVSADDVLEHSRFFDRLVELIPARYYHTEEEAPVNLKYLPKAAREQEKETRKQHAKAAKRAKLNPDTAQTALDVQKQGHKAAALASAGTDSTDAEPTDKREGKMQTQLGKAIQLGNGTGGSASMEDLKGKLQKRLEVLRQQRKAEERKEQAKKAAEWRESSIARHKEQASKSGSRKRKADDSLKPAVQPPISKGKAGDASAAQLSYGKLEFGEDGSGKKSKKQKKLSKAEMLQEAEKQTAEREALAASSEGQAHLHRQAWGSALARAKGERILDDPKLLRKSIKKDEKVRSKKASAWKDRQRQQRQDGKERQNKRRENLQARVQAKKQNKIAKREKKLMRPGFEGRRDTFINGGS